PELTRSSAIARPSRCAAPVTSARRRSIFPSVAVASDALAAVAGLARRLRDAAVIALHQDICVLTSRRPRRLATAVADWAAGLHDHPDDRGQREQNRQHLDEHATVPPCPAPRSA